MVQKVSNSLFPIPDDELIGFDRGSNPDSPYSETIHTSAHSRSVFSLTWSPGGLALDQGGLGLLASGGGDGKIIIWQIANAEGGSLKMEPVAAVREAHGVSDVNHVGWCKRDDGKGEGLLGSCGDDGGVKVWRVVAD
jgi:WD40 repeat protein